MTWLSRQHVSIAKLFVIRLYRYMLTGRLQSPNTYDGQKSCVFRIRWVLYDMNISRIIVHGYEMENWINKIEFQQWRMIMDKRKRKHLECDEREWKEASGELGKQRKSNEREREEKRIELQGVCVINRASPWASVFYASSCYRCTIELDSKNKCMKGHRFDPSNLKWREGEREKSRVDCGKECSLNIEVWPDRWLLWTGTKKKEKVDRAPVECGWTESTMKLRCWLTISEARWPLDQIGKVTDREHIEHWPWNERSIVNGAKQRCKQKLHSADIRPHDWINCFGLNLIWNFIQTIDERLLIKTKNDSLFGV